MKAATGLSQKDVEAAMSEFRKAGVRWSSVGNLLIIAFVLCLTVPFSESAYREYEDWRVSSKAAAFLRESQPDLELVVERVTPITQSRDAWSVAFRVVNHPALCGANVAIDSQGGYSGHFETRRGK
jgi:hypothetical protein